MKNPFRKKENPVGNLIAYPFIGQPVFMPKDYENFAKEGYIKNVITFRCINEIARSIAHVPICLFSGDKEVERHPLLDLLNRPNPSQSKYDFIEELISFGLISGNTYTHLNKGVSSTNTPKELWNLRSDRVEIVPGPFGVPSAYKYKANGREKTFAVDPITGQGDIIHQKGFHPCNDWYGLSPIEAAAFSIDQHNAAGMHNTGLLQNGARPSGLLVIKDSISPDDLAALKVSFMEQYQAAKNAGKVIIAGGTEMDYKELGISPKDMDFVNTTNTAARNICLAFGVPYVLVVPGESTYNNRLDARLELWEQTIIPMLERLANMINSKIAPAFGKGLEIEFNLDECPALAPRREKLFSYVKDAYSSQIITRNEARDALGYDQVDDGDEFKPQFNPNQGLAGEQEKARKKKTIKLSDLVGISSEVDNPRVTSKVSVLVQDLVRKLVRQFGADVVKEIGEDIVFEDTSRVEWYIMNHSAELISQINNTTRKKIREQLSEGILEQETNSELADRVQSVFSEASSVRASMIALTESTNIAGFAAKEAMEQARVSTKVWLTTMDGKARDSHQELDGVTIPVNDDFISSSGAKAQYPGDFGDPAEDINCRCAVAAGDFVEKGMTPEQRGQLWHKREEKRKGTEDTIIKTMQDVFGLQEDSVLQKLRSF